MNPHPTADWLEFWVRFVCGAILGAGMGLSFFTQTPASFANVWLISGACALMFGLLAGWFGDSFWRAFLRWWV